MTSAVFSGLVDMDFVLGDSEQWTVTVSVDGAAIDLTGWTIRLTFTDEAGDSFDKTESDTDWIDNTAKASSQFDVIVGAVPAGISATGGAYHVQAAIENSPTRHYLGTAQWVFRPPPGGAYAAL